MTVGSRKRYIRVCGCVEPIWFVLPLSLGRFIYERDIGGHVTALHLFVTKYDVFFSRVLEIMPSNNTSQYTFTQKAILDLRSAKMPENVCLGVVGRFRKSRTVHTAPYTVVGPLPLALLLRLCFKRLGYLRMFYRHNFQGMRCLLSVLEVLVLLNAWVNHRA